MIGCARNRARGNRGGAAKELMDYQYLKSSHSEHAKKYAGVQNKGRGDRRCPKKKKKTGEPRNEGGGNLGLGGLGQRADFA